jgi:hypothetical protein
MAALRWPPSLHLVGVAPSAAWTLAYARFRMVRDGIEPR